MLIYGAIFALGECAYSCSYHPWLISRVPEKELTRANALTNSTMGIGLFFGPAIGVTLIGTGCAALVWLSLALLCAVIILTTIERRRAHRQAAEPAHDGITALEASLRALGPQAWQLLQISAHLGPAVIPRSLIVTVFARLSWSDADDAYERERRADLAVARALGDPNAAALWRYDPATNIVDLPVFVRLAAADLDPDPSQRRGTGQATVIGLYAALTGFSDPWKQADLALPAEHARHLLSTVSDDQLDPNTAKLLVRLGFYEAIAERYRTSLDLNTRAYRWRNRVLGAGHPDTLASANNLATTLHALGDHAGARELHQVTHHALQRMLGEDHPDTLISAHNLAITLHALGDHAGACELHQVTHNALRRTRGEDHPDTLASAHNLAITLHALGDYASSLELHQVTHNALQRTRGEDHPDTLASARELAIVVQALGDYVRSRDAFQHTQHSMRWVLAHGHHDALVTADATVPVSVIAEAPARS
jgi:tetratricopeptide (TPR) repeat protein